MSLATNTRFGHYLLAEAIGAGGMGEVYRATDTNLKRDVAIKVLPESFAADADRLARFQREAEVLAALNHVNIAHIYGLERSGAVTALVMELVDGQTLAERLEQGALPTDEALNIAMQIAEALEAAHERGIVHRDLKPANIKLASNGLVKVLDFGIAKALDTRTISGPQAAQLTTPAMTEAGIVLGTAAYMSPEQARGKPVDQRADIWAFGCVLYEMLTGQLAFGGEDVTTTLARILERGADMSALPATLSADVRQAIKLCLQKEPRKRVADIRDVKLLLAGGFEIAGSQNVESVSAKHSRPLWLVTAASLAVTVALALPALQHLREQAPPETRVDIVTPTTLFPWDFALSPDGRQLVFVASGEAGESSLWLRSLASSTAEPLAGTEGARLPFWSPDSDAIGFFTDSAMKRLDTEGGTPRTLASISTPRGGSWGADNTILFQSDIGSHLLRMSANGGPAAAATTLEPQQQGHRYPQFLPDGQHFLFYASGAPDTTGIYLGSPDGSVPVRLTPADSAGVFHPDGWLLWVREGRLTTQRLDLAQAVLTGEPLTFADGVAINNIGLSALSVASSGLIAYRSAGPANTRQLTWIDRAGTVLGTLGEPDDTMSYARLSPDGRRVAVLREVLGDIWMLDEVRSSRFTFGTDKEGFPLWSPDGSRIVFQSGRTDGGAGDLYQKSSTGTGEEVLLLSSDQRKIPTSWSADGRFLMYGSDNDLYAVPMMGDPVPFVVLQTPFDERWGMFSPDGRWVAYQSNESGRNEVYMRAFVPPADSAANTAAAAGQWQLSTAGGIHPVWSPDGQELYYLDPAGNMMAVPVGTTGDAVEVGVPALLFPTRMISGGADPVSGPGRQYDVAPDGRFLINSIGDGTNHQITLIQNWDPEAAQ